MKTAILTALALVTILDSYAQPEISLDWIPEPGDEWIQATTPQPLPMAPGASGANVEWNFSDAALGGGSQIVVFHWIEPEQTPYRDSFPEANVCADLELGGFGRGFAFGYYEDDGSSFNYWGSGNQYGSDVYYDAQTMEYINMSYGSTVEDEYAGIRYSSFTQPDSFTGYTSYTYDAYGTLVLGEVTIPNAIRVHQIDAEYDSTQNFSVTQVRADTVETFAWIAEGSVFPVAQWQRSIYVSRTYINNELFDEEIEGPDTTFSFNPEYGGSSAVAHPSLPKFQLYPTITTGELQIEFDNTVDSQFMIYTTSGMLVSSGRITGEKETLEVYHLDPGYHLLHIEGYAPKVFLKQ